MNSSAAGRPDDSTRELLGEWDLAPGPDRSDGAEDSLLAPATGPRWDAPGEGPGAWPSAGGGAEGSDAGVFRDFSLAPPDDGPPGEGPAGLGWSATGAGDVPAGASRAEALPGPGETLGGFLIVGELGRGAFARVYLARQENLGRRLVALKVSRAEGDEPQILARLQHTHIVPVYSVHDDPETGLRLLCMPYLGGANLAQVLDAAGSDTTARDGGRSLVRALDLVSVRHQAAAAPDRALAPTVAIPTPLHEASATPPPAPASASASVGRLHSFLTRIAHRGRPSAEAAPPADDRDAPDQPARQFLRKADHIRAAVWIVARLAEGLDHAHSRGLLHRDLKPSNILIAGDGTPMLLDFNLATASRRDPEEGARAMLGGTLPYMAPEHLDALNPRGTTPPGAVDERADLYALGLILFEAIAGEHPFPEPLPGHSIAEMIPAMIERRRHAPSLREACPDVPWSLDALVSQCLDPDPSRRYARARDLAEDLRRFLDDLPLKHAPEPSLRERLGKWARRHPGACSTTSIALLAIALLVAAGAFVGLLSTNLQHVRARLRYRAFEPAFAECQFLLNTTSGPSDHLGRGIALADRALALQGFDRRGRWRDRAWVRWLDPREQVVLRQQLSELILLEARARVFRADKGGSEGVRREALEGAVDWLVVAEAIDPKPTAALYADRARYLSALGQSASAVQDRVREAEARLVDGRDYALLGTSLLARGDRERAEDVLRRAVALDPKRFWSWFALGHCHFEQGRYLEAAGDFGACTALQPDFAWPYMNRGLSLARAGRLSEARASYDRALKLSPKFVEALINRALCCLELDDLAAAEADLDRAIALGHAGPSALAALGEVKARRGRRDEAERLFGQLLADDPDNASYRVARAVLRLASDPSGARDDLDRVLERSPRHARAHYVLARLLRRDDPRAALAHLETALDADPDLLDAVELRALVRARLGVLSAIDDAERLARTPTAHRLYNASCALAVLSETAHQEGLAPRALALLGRALDAGFPPAEAEADPDFAPLRGSREFQDLLAKARSPRRQAP
jgi:eukaryotic-like serine/threonine-protein kinase